MIADAALFTYQLYNVQSWSCYYHVQLKQFHLNRIQNFRLHPIPLLIGGTGDMCRGFILMEGDSNNKSSHNILGSNSLIVGIKAWG